MNELWEVLRRESPHFGPELARTAYERGLAVTAKDGSTVPIPVTATPIVAPDEQLQTRVDLAGHLAAAGFKMAQSSLRGPDRERLLSALSPLERSIAEQTFERVRLLATTRVDFFIDAGGNARALELNATIPAMQGYSDIAAHTFLEVVGRHLGLHDGHIASLQAKNGSNALALFRALVHAHTLERGRAPTSIALLCRRNDAQLTEQRYLCERFRDWGVDADVVFPDELEGESALQAHGKTYDLLYRHLFVRRLEEPGLEGAPLVTRVLRSLPPSGTLILNPPISQVEVKATFARLSQATVEPMLAQAAGLTEAELEAIRASVPWTRSFLRTPALDPDGARCADLVERVVAEPGRFVLKRSWDYGGRAVFVGRTEGDRSYEERVRAAYGAAMDWATLCRRCAEDPRGGGFIVQELVPTTPERHVLCQGDAQQEVELFVDFSAYASVGLEPRPSWGGVCRGSTSHIVNIVGGGGVLPLLRSDVAQSLLTAFRARGLQ